MPAPTISNITVTGTDPKLTTLDALIVEVDAGFEVLWDNTEAHKALTDNPHSVTKTQVGLANVDNTSDLSKPISTATQTALDSNATAISTHVALTDNPHSVTKTQVGLANVDNTSDLSKPISTATQTALDDKADTDDLPAVETPYGGPVLLNVPGWFVVETDQYGHALRGIKTSGEIHTAKNRMLGEHRIDPEVKVLAIAGENKIVLTDGYGHASAILEPAATAVESEYVPSSERRSQLAGFAGKLTRLAAGVTSFGGSPVIARHAVMGDSWTFREIYRPTLATWYANRYGISGLGLINLNWRTVAGYNRYHAFYDEEYVTSVPSGSWDPDQYDYATLNTGQSVSTVVGDAFALSGTDASLFDSATLYHLPGGDVRYRWNAGTWHNLNLASGSLKDMSTDLPASGAWTLDIEATEVGAIVSMVGLDSSTAAGVVVDALGVGGSDTEQWLTQWETSTAQAQLADRQYDLVSILLGTNDQARMTPTDFGRNIEDLVDAVRSACGPNTAILFVAPPENNAGRTFTMASFSAAAREACRNKAVAFMDMQTAFGTDPTEYADEPNIWPDSLHPDEEIGGAIITSQLTRMMEG